MNMILANIKLEFSKKAKPRNGKLKKLFIFDLILLEKENVAKKIVFFIK